MTLNLHNDLRVEPITTVVDAPLPPCSRCGDTMSPGDTIDRVQWSHVDCTEDDEV